jgi:hypothetical protein
MEVFDVKDFPFQDIAKLSRPDNHDRVVGVVKFVFQDEASLTPLKRFPVSGVSLTPQVGEF